MGNCFHTPIQTTAILYEIDAYYEPKNNINHNINKNVIKVKSYNSNTKNYLYNNS